MKTLTVVLCREEQKYLGPYGQKPVCVLEVCWNASEICYKSSNCYVAHEEKKTQNKYKLVLCWQILPEEKADARQQK